VTDDTGAVLTLAAIPQRIVSLAPGATEMLFAIGAGDKVLGTSRYSDEPRAARAIPRIGDVAGLDLERILALRPDVVIVWKGGNPVAQIEQLQGLRLRLYRQHVTSLNDLPDSLRRLGLLMGAAPVANRRADELTTRLVSLRARYALSARLPVFLQIWNRPLFTIGGRHMMSDAMSLCGADNIFAELGSEAPAVSIEAVLSRNPVVIVADAPPGQALAWLADWRRFPKMAAVRRQALIPFEDPRFGMLGPSAVEATENLCALLDRHRGADSARR
jgi:iron complex transport system substrate-binding protein